MDAPHGIREELGDALFMAAKIAQMSGVDPEDALHRACDKFDRRFRAVEEAADKPLPECGEAELLALWNACKIPRSVLIAGAPACVRNKSSSKRITHCIGG